MVLKRPFPKAKSYIIQSLFPVLNVSLVKLGYPEQSTLTISLYNWSPV